MKVIGCGNVDRGDDGAGVLVARRLRAWGVDAREANSLLDVWERDDQVVVVDAMLSGREVGAIAAWDGEDVPVERPIFRSSHGLGLSDAIRLARALARLPARLRVYAIEGRRFDLGSVVSPEVAQAIEIVSAQIAGEASIERRRICLHHAGQRVDVRPVVYRLATELGLRGMVVSSRSGLVIEVEGAVAQILRFEGRLDLEKPVAAVIRTRETSRLAPLGSQRFEIRPSERVCSSR